MNPVRDDVGGEARIGQHFTQNSGIAMVQRPHGVKGVGRMTCARRESGASGIQVGIGVPQAHTNSARGRLRDNFDSPGNSGAIVSTRICPRAACQKRSKAATDGAKQIFRRMDSAPLVADERTFKMNSQRPRPQLAVPSDLFRGFDRIRQSRQSGKGRVNRRGNGGGEIAADTVCRQQPLDRRQRTGSGFHHIVPAAAMNMDVNKPGASMPSPKSTTRQLPGTFALRPRGNFCNDPIFHQYQRPLDAIQRREQQVGGDRDHARFNAI